MAVPLPGVDLNVRLVDSTGAAVGTSGNPLTTTAAAASSSMVQGMAATGAAVSGNPVYGGGKDAGGLAQPFAISTFADVNGTLVPGTTAQRVAADMMIQDAGGNATNRIRSAKDLIVGVGGGTLLGQAAGIYQTADTKFYPWLGTSASGGFVQGSAAAGAAPVGNPVSVAGWDGSLKTHLLTDTAGRTQVVGAAAAGAAVSGNPVLVGGSDGTNAQSLKTTAAGVLTVIGAGVLGDGTTGSTAVLPAAAVQYVFNGGSLDRNRANVDVTLLASGARNTNQSGTITTYNAGAIKFVLDMTVVTAGPSVTFSVFETDPASGKTLLLLAGLAVTTAVTNEYTVDPAFAGAANVSAQKRIPRTIFWQIVANNGNLGSYSLGAMILPL